MVKQIIDIGIEGNDGTGDSIRESMKKVNENFQELYAVFGIGGQIGLLDLNDTPNTYDGNENKVPVVRDDATGVNFLELSSDNALDGSIDTIGFDFSVDGKLIIRNIATRLANDPAPTLGAPLNGAGQTIANIDVSESGIGTFNAIHGTNLTIDSAVIDKGYADQNYQQKTTPGDGVRLPDEPTTVSQYTLTVDDITSGTGSSVGNLLINNHGLGVIFNGAPFVFNSDGTDPDPTELVSGGEYFVRVRDINTISLHTTEQGAKDDVDRLLISGGTGTFTITDAAYDPELAGNWLDNVAIPRKSIVRRQGDTMEGVLNLSDHPGELSGAGLRNSNDDLQAATKLYVDNISTFSEENLFVSLSGDDDQTNSPVGREGRNEALAFRTIGAACEKAEEIMLTSPLELGPYLQTITHSQGEIEAELLTAGIESPIPDRNDARSLVVENLNFIAEETYYYTVETYTDFLYDEIEFKNHIKYVLNSTSLDILIGNNANYLSRNAGLKFYSNVETRKLIKNQKTEFTKALEFARNLVRDFVLTNTEFTGSRQDIFDQFTDAGFTPDANADIALEAKFNIVLTIIDNIRNTPFVVDGNTVYKINIDNGSNTIDQALEAVNDIIPGKLVRGKTSGALGRILFYNKNDSTISSKSTDGISVQLVEPIEFEENEELEFGNEVKERQITIRIETGIYEEDYPIRVPDNVSIKGDEFRRVIVRPKNRISQSTFANIYFYRDVEFDNLILGVSQIGTIGNYQNQTDANRTSGVYTVTDAEYNTGGKGDQAIFEITVDGSGNTGVVITESGRNFRVGDIITVPDSVLGLGGAADLQFEVATVPNGNPYVNPLTNRVDGYFGRHYLENPLKNSVVVSSGFQNLGNFTLSTDILYDNKRFLQEQFIEYLETTYPSLIGFYSKSKYFDGIGKLIDAVSKDLSQGGLEFMLEAQGKYFINATDYGIGDATETKSSLEYIASVIGGLLNATAPNVIYGTDLEYPDPYLGNGAITYEAWESATVYTRKNRVSYNGVFYECKVSHTSTGDVLDNTQIDAYWTALNDLETTVNNLFNVITFVWNGDYSPPKNNRECDVFLMNNATILRNITVQGHGGFMCVLDPEGQIITKSPYIQTGSSFAASINKQAFRGGMFIDAFNSNTAVQVDSRAGDNFTLNVSSAGSQNDPQGLFIRRPETPCAFYIDGRRFQVNIITNYDPDAGTARLILDPSSNGGQGFFQDITSNLDTGVDLRDSALPVPITLQTAGNKSMLGNDFTQINDLGYGLVCVNGALSEMVSMFTYYAHTGYYSKNGSEIRSLTGNNSYGVFGLVAEGADPNEIPDSVELQNDMVQPGKAFEAQLILNLESPLSVTAGDTITQDVSGASGTVVVSGNQRRIYLKDVTGVFDTVNTITGTTLVVYNVDVRDYTNPEEALFIHVYDMVDTPSTRSEFDIFHPVSNLISRYEAANNENLGILVGSFPFVNDPGIGGIPTTGTQSGTGAQFTITKTVSNGYGAIIESTGNNYQVGDTFIISGTDLGGATPVNDATITVDSVDNGIITGISITGTIQVDDTTPVFDGIVYKLNMSTGNQEFSNDGLSDPVPWNTYIDYRRNQTFILEDISNAGELTIRPSTALIFDENPNTVYRTISFGTNDHAGNALSNTETNVGIDETYDYVRLIVDQTKSTETVLSGAGTTKGDTPGDIVIAVTSTVDENEVFRLNNNARTPIANRPVGWTVENLSEAPIFSWGGKKHYVFNYRGVETIGGIETEVAPAETNEYAIVDIADVANSDVNYPASAFGITTTLNLTPIDTTTLRAGLTSGSTGTITINISTCRATGHDFLDIGSGGFNSSNYPNVILGQPATTPTQTQETDERGKGRVFYVSTDQDGVFRVGRFFSVDQGTGTVSFSASIALSDVDGLGFKRGVVVTEFSSDTGMTDNASDAVPVESAVRGYVNRRLGFDISNNVLSNRLGAGVLAANGIIPMTGNLNAGSNTVTNLKAPVNGSDAATKSYADNSRDAYNTLDKLIDIQFDYETDNDLLISSGFKKITVDANSVVSGPFEVGDVFTGTVTGATGEIQDLYLDIDANGDDVVYIIYDPLSGEISSGGGTAPNADTIEVTGSASGLVIDGPFTEWVNGKLIASSDIAFSSTRQLTLSGTDVVDRFTELDVQIKPDTIVNADVNSAAGIAQSKLNLNAASTRSDSVGISQNDLGVVSFKDTEFTLTNGFAELKTSTGSGVGITLNKIEHIATDSVIGRSSAGAGAVSAVAFSTVISEGGGIQDNDFITTIAAGADPGSALIKTGVGTYGISNVSIAGEINSIVKTDANGKIQVQSLILGGDSSYEVLTLSGTTVIFKTPAQGEILRSVGSGTPTVQIPGSVELGGAPSSESILHSSSPLTGESALAADWMYSSFIESPQEKTAASTGVSIGIGSGKTTTGEIGMVVAGSGQSVMPFKFNSVGAVPDVDNVYNIGSSSAKYNTMYATLFNGTALEAYYADLAENYLADADYEPGTVVVFGGDSEITINSKRDDHRVAGVVSTEPATLMNSHLEGDFVTALALQGRVPCKVIGTAEKGDMLVTSAVPGYAIVNNNPKPGTVIGKSLEQKTTQDKGIIEVVVGKH